MKYILTFFSFLLLASGAVVSVQAAQYPISELGNCRDAQECYYYCEIPRNHSVCNSYKQTGAVLGESTTYQFPIAELGNCASATDCKTYCSKTENRETCTAWAQKNNLTKPQPSGTTQNVSALLEKAKSILGCTDTATCKALCEKDENKQKCQEIAKSVGMGGDQKNESTQGFGQNQQGGQGQGPGDLDCTKSENATKCKQVGASCSLFCQKNPSQCSGVTTSMQGQQGVKPSGMMNRTGSGQSTGSTGSNNPNDILKKLMEKTGCTTPQECSTYCQSHKDTCRSIVGGSTQQVQGQAGTMMGPPEGMNATNQ
jgi:hypothetical protein